VFHENALQYLFYLFSKELNSFGVFYVRFYEWKIMLYGLHQDDKGLVLLIFFS